MDDHEVVREGVRQLLESTGEIKVVGQPINLSDYPQPAALQPTPDP